MKVVILGGDGTSTKFLYNKLKSVTEIEKFIIENSISPTKIVKRRIKKLGFFRVFDQLIFQTIITKLLNYLYNNRKKELISLYNLDNSQIPEEKLMRINSVNSKQCIKTLKKINPDIVIINGTRIISKKTLNSTNGKFINTHVGITPEYRGVHGGYWSLVRNEPDKFGVTVHLVDKGIDTGSIIKQEVIPIDLTKDSFVTYPIHQYAYGFEILKSIVTEQFNNDKEKINNKRESNLYYHPRASFYLKHLILNNIK